MLCICAGGSLGGHSQIEVWRSPLPAIGVTLVEYYLFPVENAAITAKKTYPQGERLTIHYPSSLASAFVVGDSLLLVQQTEEYVLPYIFSIVNINRQAYTLVIRVDSVYKQALPLQAVLSLIALSRPGAYNSSSSGYGK